MFNGCKCGFITSTTGILALQQFIVFIIILAYVRPNKDVIKKYQRGDPLVGAGVESPRGGRPPTPPP